MRALQTMFVILLAGPGLFVAWALGKLLGRKGGLGADGIDSWTFLVITITLLFEAILIALGRGGISHDR